MAVSTYKTFLMMKDGATEYTKLIDIKDYPDLGGTPDTLETTTLSDGAQTFIPGIDSVENLEFTANYTLEDYETLVGLKGEEKEFSVWFGGTVAAGVATPTGSEGKYNFKGYLVAYPTGGDVNAVRELQISITPSSAITLGV